MIRKLLPVLLLVLGLGLGAGVGIFLKPAPSAEAAHAVADTGHGAPEAEGGHGAEGSDGHGDAASGGHYSPETGPTDTVRLPNQFVVPVLHDGRVEAMVVIGLALELNAGHGFDLATDEPRLRAALLQLLFDHANIGGFDGLFTSGEVLLSLRRALVSAARGEIGPDVQDVLITELLRQES
ncbi:flagellar basal body-associated protein FliL [Rhodobacter sp. NTK016B]|uniref:flagellar basal body-associated protein FliL n=1 Tax=Rhodobacter sp. NTK016B TaxID=2759676 RepID=UPI001A8F4050|nr:flagellar basal body-associated protein FliL [Rhodobacter sp. NTK016B]MBN8292978.1 flagellar basal body-associated protein FliL [Rhodobacter sp. NTK016B]